MINTKAIRHRMVDLDLTNAQLADEAEVSPSYMSSVIYGKKALTLEMAKKLKGILQVPDEKFSYYFLADETKEEA